MPGGSDGDEVGSRVEVEDRRRAAAGWWSSNASPSATCGAAGHASRAAGRRRRPAGRPPRPRRPTGPCRASVRAATAIRHPSASPARAPPTGIRIGGERRRRSGADVAGEITAPAGDSLFSSAVRCARRLTSSLRRASASSAWNSRSAGLPTWAAAVAARRSSTTRRVWVSTPLDPGLVRPRRSAGHGWRGRRRRPRPRPAGRRPGRPP